MLLQLGTWIFSIILLVFLWTKTFRRPLDSRIPVFKFPYWSVLGTFRIIHQSRRSCQSTSASIITYVLQALHAHNIIYPEAAVIGAWFAFTPFLILNKAESVKELLSRNNFLEKSIIYNGLHPMGGRGLGTREGSKYRPRRKVLNPAFHHDVLKGFVDVFNKQSKIFVGLLEAQCRENWVDIVKYSSFCSFDIMCETILGVRGCVQMDNNNMEFFRSYKRAVNSMATRMFRPHQWVDFLYKLSPAGRQLAEDINVMHEFSIKVFKERKLALTEISKETKNMNNAGHTRTRERKIFLDVLLDNEELTEKDIKDELTTFIAAGHDTVTMAISWTLYYIGLFPDVQAKIHEELFDIFGSDNEREVTMEDMKMMHYLECVIKESQRLHPSIPIIGREAEEDVKLYGYDVKKGTQLIIPIYSLHRDPNIFPNPEKFDPSRFFPENCVGRDNYVYIPFSLGLRSCIGQQFATLEMKTILAHVLRNFSLRSLEPLDQICCTFDVVLRPTKSLKIKVMQRH